MKKKLIIFPYALWMIIFAIVPLLLILIAAFNSPSLNFTTNNIVLAFDFSAVFLRSILFGGISTAICLLIAYPFSYLVSKASKSVQSFLIMAVMIPMWTNFLLRTYAWMTLLEHNGIINNIIFFLCGRRLELINNSGAVILGMVYNFLPFMIMPIHSSFAKIDKKLTDAAEDLGANSFQVFAQVLFPLSVPGVISGITMVFVPSVSTFVISKMLGGSNNILIGDLIEMQFLSNSYNPHLGSAISLILMVIVFLCAAITNQLDRNHSKN